MVDRRRKAFTLIELMIVVAIIGTLSSIALPAFKEYVRKSKYSEATTTLGAMFKAEASAYQIRNVEGGNRPWCYVPWVGGFLRTPTPSPFVWGPSTSVGECSSLGFTPGPLYFTYGAVPSADVASGCYHGNYAIEDLDGNGMIGALFEYVAERDSQLYRVARYEIGEAANVAAVAASLPAQPCGS